MSKFNWMPILRTGTFTDKNDQTVTIDEAALDKVIAATDLSKEPQLVVEHPRFDDIGFGTIDKLKRVGGYLFALPKTVQEKFKNAVNSGKLPGRSVTLGRNNFSLNNISFLPPDIPPAVSGLGAYSFEAKAKDKAEVLEMQLVLPGVESHFADLETSNFEFATYEVSAYPFRLLKDVMGNLRDFFIDKFNLETADKVLPKYQIDSLGNRPRVFIPDEPKATNEFSKNINNGDNKMFDISKIDLTKVDPNIRTALEGLAEENKTLTKNLADKDVELQAATSKLTVAETETLRNEILQFCAGDDVKLKIMPAVKDKVVNFLMAQKEKGVIEFSAANNTTVKMDAFDFGKELVKMLPDVIELSELATKGEAGEDKSEAIKVGESIAAAVNPAE